MAFSVSLLAACLLAAPAPTEERGHPGKPGWVIDVPAEVAIGSTVTVDLDGPADAIGLLMVSSGEGPVHSKKYGTLYLSFPLLLDFMFPFDSQGSFTIEEDIPCDPELIGITVYVQFITCNPHVGASNQLSVTFTDQSDDDGDTDSDNADSDDGDSDDGDSGCDDDNDSDNDDGCDDDSDKDSDNDSDKDSDKGGH